MVNADLESDDPVAYAFLNTYTLNEAQLNTLMDAIAKADNDGIKGSKTWLQDNRNVVKPWLAAAKQAQ